jgi:4-hydroxy-tetrahydrodipicolinate reductase
MKIALIGYGKMGQMIAKLAPQRNHTVAVIIDRKGPQQVINPETLQNADVCIDFTSPQDIMKNIQAITDCKKNLVIGTTGWTDHHLNEVEALVKKSRIGCLYASNFSIGVQLFLRFVSHAATLINQFDEYDVGGWEAHHNQKVDSPSGTTQSITQTLLDHISRKTAVVHDLGNRKIEPHELHFPSLRCGSLPGTHHVCFDSPSDTITLSHIARNRESFANGALKAAEWLDGKSGLYHINDMLSQINRR